MKTNKPGRPFVPPHLKRNKMVGVRIQQWMLDRLRNQPESGGKIIEKLLNQHFMGGKMGQRDLKTIEKTIDKTIAEQAAILKRLQKLLIKIKGDTQDDRR